MEPWEWSEDVWRSKVNKVRAGRSLTPKRWKDGKRCAVALSSDNDHKTNELFVGGNSLGRMSQGQYGNRVGVPRMLNVLAKNDIWASFFVPAVCALRYPDEQRRLVAEGHGGAAWLDP